MSSDTHIVPLFVGDPERCKQASDILLEEHDIYIQPINYPTVAKGTERLRITPSPYHDDGLIDQLAEALLQVWERLGLPLAREIAGGRIASHRRARGEIPAPETVGARCFAGPIRLYSADRDASAPVKASAGIAKGASSDAARLGRDRSRLRLHRIPVFRRQPWRPPLADPARPRQRADLSAVAGDLLHILDVLRLGRIRHPHQRGFSRDLYRPDPDDRVLHAAAAARDPAGEIAEHHLDRRFHRGALRQEPGGRRYRGADRDHRIGSLHRAPAQGGGVVA